MTKDVRFVKVRIALGVMWFFEQFIILFVAMLGGLSISFFAFLIVHMFSFAVAVKVFVIKWPISTLIIFVCMEIKKRKERLESQKTCEHMPSTSIPLRLPTTKIEGVMLCLECKQTYYQKWEPKKAEIDW